MSIDPIQTKAASYTAASSAVITLDSPTQNGTLLVLCYSKLGAGASSSVSDNGGNTYSSPFTGGVGGVYNFVTSYAGHVAAGTTAVTITFTGGPVTGDAILREYPVYDVSPLDKNTGATGTSPPPASGNTAATTQAIELVVGLGFVIGKDMSLGAGYSHLTIQGNATTGQIAMEDLTTSSTGAQAAAFDANSTTNWACACLTFTPGTAPPMPLGSPTILLMGIG